eukprot:scaffold68619_cov61-Phaeocystis_antarctica.AAC.5
MEVALHVPAGAGAASVVCDQPAILVDEGTLLGAERVVRDVSRLVDDALVKGDLHVARVVEGLPAVLSKLHADPRQSVFLARVALELLARLRHQGRHIGKVH